MKDKLSCSFEVLQEYPNCQFKKGQILVPTEKNPFIFHNKKHSFSDGTPLDGIDLSDLEKYPNIFKEL